MSGGGGGGVGPAASAFLLKLELACRTSLAVLLATGLSFLYNWSSDLTWFSIVLSIAGVRKSMGETLVAAADLWYGGVFTVPLIYIIATVRFSKVLTAVLLFVAVSVLVAYPGIGDAGKRMGGIFVTVVPLLCAADPELSYGVLLERLFLGLAFANAFSIICLLIPYPRLAHRLCADRLLHMERAHVAMLRAFVQSFNLSEAVHLSTIDQGLGQLTTHVAFVRDSLPYVKWEVAIMRAGEVSSWRRLSSFVCVVEGEWVELMEGLRITLAKLVPNRTHREFVRYLSVALEELVEEAIDVLHTHGYAHMRHILRHQQGGCYGACCGGRGEGEPGGLEECHRLLAQVLMDEYIKARVSVIYGMHILDDPTTPPPLPDITTAAQKRHLSLRDGSCVKIDVARKEDVVVVVAPPSPPPPPSAARPPSVAVPTARPSPPPPPARRRKRYELGGGSGGGGGDLRLPLVERRVSKEQLFAAFLKDYNKLGYRNVLPRNAYLLDLRHMITRALPHTLQAAKYCSTRQASKQGGGAGGLPTATAYQWWNQFVWSRLLVPWPRLVAIWRQPLKVSCAALISGSTVLVPSANSRLGPATIWGVIALCQTMAPYPSSSFKSGYNRIQGTVLGSIFGLALMEWIGLREHDRVAILVALTAWVFMCSFCRSSAMYGEAAMVAAVTAPVIVVGPILGGHGAMVRIEQTILGTVIYVAVDNLFWPVRAKLDLREELRSCLQSFAELWHHTLSIFFRDADAEVSEVSTVALKAQLRASFKKQERFISLAMEEPELWHKPFYGAAYRHVVQALQQVNGFMSMLCRASAAFPRTLGPRDRDMLTAIQDQIKRLGTVTTHAIEEAASAVKTMAKRSSSSSGTGGGVVPPPPTLSLLGLGYVYWDMQDFIDDYMRQHVLRWREQDESDFIITSSSFIISVNGMIFAMEGIGKGLVRLGHAIRELVERERNNVY